MIEKEMIVTVHQEQMRVMVVGVFSAREHRAYMRIILPSGVRFDHRAHHGFKNPWDSAHYVGQVIEATTSCLDDPAPYSFLDLDTNQLSLFDSS